MAVCWEQEQPDGNTTRSRSEVVSELRATRTIVGGALGSDLGTCCRRSARDVITFR